MSLTIALNNGTEIVAKRLNSATYPAIAALLWEEGEAFPDLSSPEARRRVAPLMFRRLRDPEFIKSLAFALVTIFPDIPEELVWYDSTQKPSFGVAGLDLDEILKIITTVSDAIKITSAVDAGPPEEPEEPSEAPAIAETKPKVEPPKLVKKPTHEMAGSRRR